MSSRIEFAGIFSDYAQENPQLFPQWTTFRQYTNVTGVHWPFVNTTLGMNVWTVFGVTPDDTGRSECYMDRGQLQYDSSFNIYSLANAQDWLIDFTKKIRTTPVLRALPAKDQNHTFLEHFVDWQNSPLTKIVLTIINNTKYKKCMDPLPLPTTAFVDCFRLWTNFLGVGAVLGLQRQAAGGSATNANLTEKWAKFNLTGLPHNVTAQLERSLIPPASCPGWQCLGMQFGPRPANTELKAVWIQTSTTFHPDWKYKRMNEFWQVSTQLHGAFFLCFAIYCMV